MLATTDDRPSATRRKPQVIPMANPPLHQIGPGSTVKLTRIETDGKDFHKDKGSAESEFKQLRDEFIEWQPRLFAEQKQKLLIVLQAMDAGGKDGVIRAVFQGVNPQGVNVSSFKVPSAEERAHDFLWRIHRAVPAQGMIGVFNRSHYEDVVVVRVDQLAPEPVWRARYELINDFEKLLTTTGTTLLKFYLHVSQKEQLQRLQERMNNPAKRWKYSLDDLEKRKSWDSYMTAYSEALEQCSTPRAPWYVIPADQNWYRNLAIMRILVATCREMDPQYPT